jgi:hypothetical protein
MRFFEPSHAVLLLALLTAGCGERTTPSSGPAAPLAPATDVGFVFDVRGDWVYAVDQRPINPGDGVAAGVAVKQSPPVSAENRLIIALRSGELLTITDEKFDIPKKLDSAPQNRFWSLAKARYHSSFVTAQSRGGGDAPLRDGVLVWENGKLQVATAFEKVPDGDYELTLKPVADVVNNGAPDEIKLGTFTWRAASPPAVKIDALTSGIYELDVKKPARGGEAPLEQAALVVIGSPSEAKALTEEYRNAVQLTEGWGEKAPQDSVRQFLRSTLAGLAVDVLKLRPAE